MEKIITNIALPRYLADTLDALNNMFPRFGEEMCACEFLPEDF